MARGRRPVVAAGFIGALMSEDEPEAGAPLRPFHLEASITVWSNAQSIGTNVAGDAAQAPIESRGLIRWWWQDRDHFRWEYEQLSPDPEVLRVIGDGRSQWTVHDPENTYVQEPLPDWPDDIRVRPMAMSVMLGPLPLSDDLSGVDGILRWLNDIGDGGWNPKVLRDDQFLGRKVTVVAMPAYTHATSRTNPDTGETEQIDTKEGRMELWVDLERMMVLKHIVDSGVQTFEAVVTTLEYDADVPAERFVFDVRPGAIKLDGTGIGELYEANVDVPPGYLRVKVPLRGYRYRGGSQGINADNQVLSVTMRFVGPNDAALTVVQERKPFPPELREGDLWLTRGLEAYASTTDQGWQRLAWEEAGLSVTIEARAATIAELVAMAQSMVLVE